MLPGPSDAADYVCAALVIDQTDMRVYERLFGDYLYRAAIVSSFMRACPIASAVIVSRPGPM